MLVLDSLATDSARLVGSVNAKIWVEYLFAGRGRIRGVLGEESEEEDLDSRGNSVGVRDRASKAAESRVESECVLNGLGG